jgi:pimeloyl-ACP methyl ester carboxylesterase
LNICTFAKTKKAEYKPMAGKTNLFYSASKPSQPNPVVMLLVHGAGSNHLVWPSQLRRDTSIMVIAIDLPGHGRSGGLPEQSIAKYAKHVLHFLDEIGIYRVFLAGHSMGGAIGIQICKTSPERVTGLALISSGASLHVPKRTLDLLSNPGSTREAIRSIEPLLFGSGASLGLRKQVIKSMENSRSGVLYSDWLACSSFYMRADWKISRPVWIAVGREDKITPPEAAKQLLARIPRSRISYFEEAGHMLILEKPMEISSWLLSIPSKLP